MEIPMKEEELLEPERHRDAIKELFVRLVEYCLGISKGELSQPIFNGLQGLAYPELYDDTFFQLSLVRESTRLMTICGELDFGHLDFVAPSAERLQQQLSAVINLAKYRVESLEFYRAMNEDREIVLSDLDELKVEQDQIRSKLEEAKQAAMQDNGALQEVYAEISEVEAEIAQLNEQNMVGRRETNDNKKKYNSMKDAVETISLSIQELKNEEKKLVVQIVPSPERLQKDMSTLEATVDAERKESSAIEKQARSMKVAVTNVASATETVSESIDRLKEIRGELDKENILHADVRNAKEKVSKNTKNLTQLKDNTNFAKRQIHKYEEKLVLIQKQGNIKKDAAQKALDDAQTKLLQVEKDRRDGVVRIEVYEEKNRLLESAIENEAKETKEEVSLMRADYQKMATTIIDH
eukprot:CAMPEP_0194280680 /NCGR_PEP_ID=MMETSP0169-20130528/18334_1 /TAXON_ID=218684 /ORGANISM="Corethron pennatum, Strain L29A3" /LENGTH=409 /DNA_ID=CAMNT_0039025491 /DNA_START=224 /DNA_END=1450 /DNA_ORIENTATION=+